MSKYTFNKIDSDTSELIYKDKRYEIKKDVDLQRKVQNIYNQARTKMMLDLTKQGITKKDLVIERKENNKTFYDNSNAVELEQGYIEVESSNLYETLSQKYFNMSLEEIMKDIGLTDEKEQEKFGEDFTNAMMGKTETPSKK